MLNELKRSSKEATADLKEILREHVKYALTDPEHFIQFYFTMVQECREVMVERSRERILERLHEECWKACFRWKQMRDGHVHPSAVNTAFGSATALIAVISFIKSDGVEIDLMVISKDDEDYVYLDGLMTPRSGKDLN